MKPPLAGPPERWFSLFGLTVVRKTDLLAAAAFVLSISTVIVQLYGFARGARPRLYPPDTLYIRIERYANRDLVTRFAGQISLTNSGDAGESAILRDLTVTATAGPLTFSELWLSFARAERIGSDLVLVPLETAHPVVVGGGSAVSNLVSFAPFEADCGDAPGCNRRVDYVGEGDFLNAVHAAGGLSIVLSGHVIGSGALLRAACRVRLDDDALAVLVENQWYGTRCFES